MKLIRILSLDTFINADHIIRADYFPTHEISEDDYGKEINPPRTVPSRLELVLSEIVLEESTGYDGAVNGVASMSKVVRFYGENADKLNSALADMAFYTI